jgi:prepilin peptidase CpaA
MFGRTEPSILLYCVAAISLVAIISDLARGRIYNWLTLPALIAGLGASLGFAGFPGLASGLLGAVAGLALFGWMFAIGMTGGGDVKLLMALGAWGGLEFTLKTAFFSVILGGAMALVILAVRGRLLDFARRMYRFLLSVFVRELAVEKPKLDPVSTMPFGIPIAASAVWIAAADPFVRWGILRW